MEEKTLSLGHIRYLEGEAKIKGWTEEKLEQEKNKLREAVKRVGFTEEEKEREKEKQFQLEQKAKQLGYSNYLEQLEAERKAKILGLNEQEKQKEREKLLLEKKARELGYSSYSEQILAKEKGIEKKIIEENIEAKELLEERARDLGYSSYSEQRKEILRKKFEEPFTQFSSEKIVVSPPMKKKIDALEFTNPQIPGEIKIDKSGKLLKRYFEFEGPVGSRSEERRVGKECRL